MSNKHPEHEHKPNDKYRQAFDSFLPAGTEAAIKSHVSEIIDKEYEKAFTKETLCFLYSTIDLTTLSPKDNKTSISAFVGAVNDRYHSKEGGLPSVAAICVYPSHVKQVKEELCNPEVRIASVSGGFPASQTLVDTKLMETSFAIQDGANEIDIVLNIGCFLDEDWQNVDLEIREQKEHAKGATLKVIIESGLLKEPELIRRASIMALFSGADFIKTSTGKDCPGASLEAVYIMARVIKEYADKFGVKCGLKVSGGIRTPEEAVQYYCIVKSVLGEDWLNNKLFRIGASSLEANLRKKIAEM